MRRAADYTSWVGALALCWGVKYTALKSSPKLNKHASSSCFPGETEQVSTASLRCRRENHRIVTNTTQTNLLRFWALRPLHLTSPYFQHRRRLTSPLRRSGRRKDPWALLPSARRCREDPAQSWPRTQCVTLRKARTRLHDDRIWIGASNLGDR